MFVRQSNLHILSLMRNSEDFWLFGKAYWGSFETRFPPFYHITQNIFLLLFFHHTCTSVLTTEAISNLDPFRCRLKMFQSFSYSSIGRSSQKNLSTFNFILTVELDRFHLNFTKHQLFPIIYCHP